MLPAEWRGSSDDSASDAAASSIFFLSKVIDNVREVRIQRFDRSVLVSLVGKQVKCPEMWTEILSSHFSHPESVLYIGR